jgi:hypothetical protein
MEHVNFASKKQKLSKSRYTYQLYHDWYLNFFGFKILPYISLCDRLSN